MKRTIIIKDAASARGISGAPAGSRALGRGARVALTFFCALAADGLQWLLPPLWPVFDGGMVLATLILWGWRWEVLVAVIPELIPGLELAPTWTIFAAYLAATQRTTSSPKPVVQVSPPRSDHPPH